jgi:S-formylglutathione hydrolase
MKTLLHFSFLFLFLLFFVQGILSAPLNQGKLVTVKVHSQGLENNVFNDAATRNVTVYLPACYEEENEKSFPVIYLLPWENSDNKAWFNIHNGRYLQEIMDNCILAGKIKPLIVVVPDNKNKLNGSWYTNSAATGNWEDYIVNDVVNYIDAEFRTIPIAEGRGIAGHSMGGYGALKLATKHPGVFCAVYAMNAFVDLNTFINNEYIWKESIDKAISAGSLPTGDQLADKLLAMSAAFAPNLENPPFFGNLFKTTEGKIDNETAEKWLEQDPMQLIASHAGNLKNLKALTIDCSNSDATIYLNSKYSDKLKQNDVPHTFRYYQGNQERLLLDRLREFMLPMFSETLDHSFLKVLNYRHSFTKSDHVSAKLLKSGKIYVVPENISGNLKEIAANAKLSIDAAPGQVYDIRLEELTHGIYKIYGISSNGFIDNPLKFGVNGGIPRVTICAVDSYTGEQMCCNVTVNGVRCPGIPSGGFTLSAMGEISLCLDLENYCPIEKKVTIYTDTVIRFPMVKDSYLKVVDKTSKEPVSDATVTYHTQTSLTDSGGAACIQNLQNGTLDCRIFKKGYFTEVISAPHIPGQTATIEITRRKASVNFVLSNTTIPVSGIPVLLDGKEAFTGNDGIVCFEETDARSEHSYTINSSCYEPVSGSFYLETDTTIRLILQPDIHHLGSKLPFASGSLLIRPEVDGTFYVVAEGTEQTMAAISQNYIWEKQVIAGMEIMLNLDEFPGDTEYWLYFIPRTICNHLKSGRLYSYGNGLEENKISLYPNPVNEELTIQINRKHPFKVEIINIHGKILYQSEETGTSHKVDLLSFSSGIYFVRVRSDDFTVMQKILKQ